MEPGQLAQRSERFGNFLLLKNMQFMDCKRHKVCRISDPSVESAFLSGQVRVECDSPQKKILTLATRGQQADDGK